jgi:ectoine hydroxylase-related dioxygenase (phytanoyl-CoA dioxygenase family)
VNTVKQILSEFGVTEDVISAEEKEALDRDGYVVFPNVIDEKLLNALRAAFEAGCGRNGSSAVLKESGTRHVNDLANGDRIFEVVYTNPRALAAVYHILRDEFRVGQIGGRDPLPGFGQQGLHADWTARFRGEPFRIVTTIWLLDDFTAQNGATRVVPGTHLLLGQPPKKFADPASRHPDQKIITARAGSVLIFNGHLWHSGTTNKSSRSRRVVQCVFVGRNQLRFSRVQIANPASLRPAASYILGYDLRG